MQKIILIIFILLLTGITGHSAPFKNLKLTLSQPDGSELELYASGDEYYNWLHDRSGYTVLLGEDGYYYYAKEEGGQLVASEYKVGQANPQTLGIKPGLKKSRAATAPQRAQARSENSIDGSGKPVYAPRKGRLNNIVIFISFNDDTEFTTPRSAYNTKFNSPSGPSLHHYYQEVSYKKLDITSSYFPVCGSATNLSYKDSKNRSYYLTTEGGNANGYPPGNDFEKMDREHGLLRRAINALKPQIEANFSASDLDADGDGNVDNICFVIRGNCAGWSELLWAHRWTLYSTDVRIQGKRVYDYVFQPENQVDVRTLCHEMFHSLGAPDLYHYSYDGFTPVGIWDLMEDSDAHMGAYMKWRYAGGKWITDIPEISCSGTYTLHPLTDSVNNCYKIRMPGPGNEFLMIEYRRTKGLYEGTLPGSGLIIYRINPTVTQGNRNGPPDEVYIYRPGGSLSNDGDILKAHFSANEGRTELSMDTDSKPFKSNGDIADITIGDISMADTTISFTVGGLRCKPPTVDSLFPLDYSGSNDTVCQGNSVRISCKLKNEIGPCSYIWEPLPAGSFIIDNALSGTPTIQTTDLAAGNYWMKVTVIDPGEIPTKTVTDTVSFYVRELPVFSIKPQDGNYCLTKQAIPLNNIGIYYNFTCYIHPGQYPSICQCLYRQDLIDQGYIFEGSTYPCRKPEQIYQDLWEYFGGRLDQVYYTDIVLSTEYGVIGGTPPYRYYWNRCSNTPNLSECIPLNRFPGYDFEFCGKYYHPVTGKVIPVNIVVPTNDDRCGFGKACTEIYWNINNGNQEEATTTIFPGCNCISLTVTDAHGCSSKQTVNPVGHYFDKKTITIQNPPLTCGMPAVLSADSHCPGEECDECFKKCNSSPQADIIWGPAEIVSGTGPNATTIPLWQNETIWAIFVDPITGCRDTVYQKLNISCPDPTVPVISLKDASFCSANLPSTITATTKGTKGPCSYLWETTWGAPVTTGTPTLNIPAGLKNCHTVIVTVTDNGYSPAKKATSRAEVCISPTPENFTLSTNRKEVCIGDTVLLTASNYGSVSFYQWQANGGIVNDHWDGTATATVLSQTATFTLVASGSGAEAQKCKKSADIKITGHKLTAKITPVSGFKCGDMQGTLSAAASSCSQKDAIVKYEWGPAGAFNGDMNKVTAVTKPVSVATTFYVNVWDNFGCKGHTEVSIGDGICEVVVSGDTLCQYDKNGSKVSYAYPSVSVIGGTPTISWKSVSSSLPQSYIYSSNSAEPSIYITSLAPGDYPIGVDVSDGVTTQTYRTTIRILGNPKVTLKADVGIACVGEDITLQSTVTPNNVKYKYYWLNGASGPEAGTTGSAVIGTPGSYNYMLKVENEYGCYGTTTANVIGRSKAFLCLTTKCTGSSSYEVNIDVLGGSTPYNFYSDENLTTLVPNTTWNPAKDFARIKGLPSGSGHVFYLGGSNLCHSEQIEVFQECDCYAGAFLNCDTLGCDNSKDTARIQIKLWGSVLYSFDLIAPDGTVAMSVDKGKADSWVYAAIRPHGGIYKIANLKGYTTENDTTGCEGEVYGDANVIFPRKPEFTISALPQKVCIGDTVNLTTRGMAPDIICKWTTTQGSNMLNPNQPDTKVVITSAQNTFTLTADGGNGCTTEQQVEVTGHKVTIGKIITNPANNFACNGSGTLTVSTAQCNQAGCPLSYHWSPSTALQTTTGATVNTLPLKGLTTFRVNVTDAIGCKDSTEIKINTGICEVSAKGDTLCAYQIGSADSLAKPVVMIKGGVPAIIWKDLSGKGLTFNDTTSASPTIDITRLAPGSYPVEVTINDGFAIQKHTTAIQIIANPSVTISADKTTACVGETIHLHTTVSPLGDKYNYYWLNGTDGPETSGTATATMSRSGDNRYIVKITNNYGCFAYDTITVKGRKGAFLCAMPECVDEETYKVRISVLGGAPPYELFTDSARTVQTGGTWKDNEITISGLTSGQAYKYYLSGANLCQQPETEVYKDCTCKTGTLVCDAGLYIYADEPDCNSETDSTRIHIKTWGAGTYSFRLIAPNGSTVMTVTDETATEWTYPVARNQAGEYKIQDFSAFTEGVGQCPQKIYGTAKVIFPEKTTVEAGKDLYICAGQKATLTATGNAVGYIWDNGVRNAVPFTPAQSQIYHVEGITLNGCKVKDSVWIYIEDPAKITWQSADVTIEKGQDATFEVQTTNGIPVSFKWERLSNGKWITLSDGGSAPRVAGSTTKYLALYNIPVSWKNNRLRCTATSKCGTDIAYFNIQVTGCVDAGNVTLSMEEGITPDEIPGDPIDGWYCRGVRIGVRATVSGITIPKDLTYKWTVDGLPVNYSQTEYISWIPAMWEDDIVLKVCVYSQELCDTLCSTHIRLKSKAFEDASVRIATSIDPRRTFCKGEVIHCRAVGKNLGENPEYQWYNDIFDMGTGKIKTIPMSDRDTWIRLKVKISHEICVKNRLLEDTAFFKQLPEVSPVLNIKFTPNDTPVCRYTELEFKADYRNAGSTPLIIWEKEIWNQGTGKIKKITIDDKDTWIHCMLIPSNDVCSVKDTVHAVQKITVIENDPAVFITSDMKEKKQGETISFQAKIEPPIKNIKYHWYINDMRNISETQNFSSSILKKGDKIQCLVSGEKSCQQNIGSNIIYIDFQTKRDTTLTLFKNETLKNISLIQEGDKNTLFEISAKAENGTATLTADGTFRYSPYHDYIGGDVVPYIIRDKQTRKILDEGTIYITVFDNERFFVPNIITPNGDGINDAWEIDFLKDYTDYVVSIYDRNGFIVFQTRNYTNTFDGSGRGEGYITSGKLPNGIYTYIIRIDKKKQLKSWLEIRQEVNLRNNK